MCGKPERCPQPLTVAGWVKIGRWSDSHPSTISPRVTGCIATAWSFSTWSDGTSASSSMAEQRTLNPQVLGSNPRGRTF